MTSLRWLLLSTLLAVLALSYWQDSRYKEPSTRDMIGAARFQAVNHNSDRRE